MIKMLGPKREGGGAGREGSEGGRRQEGQRQTGKGREEKRKREGGDREWKGQQRRLGRLVLLPSSHILSLQSTLRERPTESEIQLQMLLHFPEFKSLQSPP